MISHRIFLDVDNIVADFVGGACALHGIPLETLLPQWSAGEGWDFYKYMNLTEDAFYGPMDYAFWANLPLTSDCYQILNVLEHMVGPENIRLLTAPSRNVGCKPGKEAWVIRHLPQYQNRLIIDRDKRFYAHAHAILVDDSDVNVDAFRAAGGRAVLYPRHWNSNHDKQDFALKYLEAWLPTH